MISHNHRQPTVQQTRSWRCSSTATHRRRHQRERVEDQVSPRLVDTEQGIANVHHATPVLRTVGPSTGRGDPER